MTTPKKKIISEMTPEQEQQLIVWRDECLKIGLRTGRVDRAAAEKALPAVYTERGFEPDHRGFWHEAPKRAQRSALPALPKNFKIYWCDSPQSGAKKAAELANSDAQTMLGQCCYGNQDMYWLAHWAFVIDVLGGECDADPHPMIELAKNCGWFWAFDEACVLTEHPKTLFRDDEFRLHSTTALAVEYEDSWGVAAVHGTRVPSEWVGPNSKLTAEIALTWPNVEQRRAAAEILGWDKILSTLGARTIDKDKDPEIGELLEVDLPDSPNSRFLRVKCGTGRQFSLPVPQTTRTALEAQALIHGFDNPADFVLPEVRT